MVYLPLVFLAFMLGASLASFFQVVADRVPRKQSLVTRSMCPSCKRTLTWVDLIPIFSYLVLQGRCRTCKTTIPATHLFYEMAVGVVFAALAALILVRL